MDPLRTYGTQDLRETAFSMGAFFPQQSPTTIGGAVQMVYVPSSRNRYTQMSSQSVLQPIPGATDVCVP